MDGIAWMRRVALLLLFVTASILPAFAQTGKRHTPSKSHVPSLELTGFRPFTPPVSVDDTVKMTAAGNYIFILVGKRLYKVDQKDLRVVQTRQLYFDAIDVKKAVKPKKTKGTKRVTRSKSRNKLDG